MELSRAAHSSTGIAVVRRRAVHEIVLHRRGAFALGTSGVLIAGGILLQRGNERRDPLMQIIVQPAVAAGAFELVGRHAKPDEDEE